MHLASAQDIVLYQRTSSYIPRVAAVHDICGYGNCSLGIAMPVLSAAGIDVCPVPTAVFSSHTKYTSFSFLDTSPELDDFLAAWRAIRVALDGVYSGFLGSSLQVERIRELYETYPEALRILDPVMGDAGEIYATYTDELCRAMGGLTEGADLLTPNLTEAAILTGRKYQGQDPDDEEVRLLLRRLVQSGAKHIVLKGVVRGQKIYNYIAGRDCETLALGSELLPFNLHGTGDLYCSCLTAALYAGKDLAYAVDFAADIVRRAMLTSRLQPDYDQRGVSFEREIRAISQLID